MYINIKIYSNNIRDNCHPIMHLFQTKLLNLFENLNDEQSAVDKTGKLLSNTDFTFSYWNTTKMNY